MRTNDRRAGFALLRGRRSRPIMPVSTLIEFALKGGTALLMLFAATVVLVHMQVYLAGPTAAADFSNIF
jgi:hypothetical protein